MSDFRMAMVDSAIDLIVQNHTHADASSNSYVDDAGFARGCAAIYFPESRSVCVIFHGHGHTKFATKNVHRVSSFPPRQIVNVSQVAGHRIELTSATYSNSIQFAAGPSDAFGEGCRYLPHGMVKTARNICGEFALFSNPAGAIYYGDCDFCASNVNRPNHWF
jgi:hypothetical protein